MDRSIRSVRPLIYCCGGSGLQLLFQLPVQESVSWETFDIYWYILVLYNMRTENGIEIYVSDYLYWAVVFHLQWGKKLKWQWEFISENCIASKYCTNSVNELSYHYELSEFPVDITSYDIYIWNMKYCWTFENNHLCWEAHTK